MLFGVTLSCAFSSFYELGAQRTSSARSLTSTSDGLCDQPFTCVRLIIPSTLADNARIVVDADRYLGEQQTKLIVEQPLELDRGQQLVLSSTATSAKVHSFLAIYVVCRSLATTKQKPNNFYFRPCPISILLHYPFRNVHRSRFVEQYCILRPVEGLKVRNKQGFRVGSKHTY
jgi:hypothetical protein